MTNTILQVEHIEKRYSEQTVLDDIVFDLQEGEILGVIGPNGAGKTTLLECLTGLIPANGGLVKWLGQPLSRALRKQAMFYIPDNIEPYAEHTVMEVLKFFTSIYRKFTTVTQTAINAFKLEPVIHKNVGTLSKGYRKRLLLALSLIVPHQVIVMDEPFDGLDPRQTRDVMILLRDEVNKGRTLLLSIHQLSDAERICDRFILLGLGTVCGKGTMNELREQSGLSSGTLEDIFYAVT